MRRFVPLMVFVAVLAGCSGGGGVPKGAIAVVNGQPIAQKQFDALVQRRGTSQLLKHAAVQYLVQRVEFEQEAEKLGLTVDDQEIAARLAAIKQQYFGGNESRYEKQLKQQDLTNAEIHDNVKALLIQEKVFKRVTRNLRVTDTAVREYYEGHRSQYVVPERRTVAHILVKSKALADRLYRRLQSGASFAQLAEEYSQDVSSKSRGGKLTIAKGQTVRPFDRTAFLLSTGHISQPVKTGFGWHVIKALGPLKPAKTKPFASVKTLIRQQLLQQKRNAAMNKWRAQMARDFEGKVSYRNGYAPR